MGTNQGLNKTYLVFCLLFLVSGLSRPSVEVACNAGYQDDSSRQGDKETRGDDGTTSAQAVGGITIPLIQCPVKHIKVNASDGQIAKAAYRVPFGPGPFPAIIFIHGGSQQASDTTLEQMLTSGAVATRFLAAGFVTVQSTFRSYADDMQSEGPILDNIAIYEYVKRVPEVDAHSVVLYGGSGGGAIVLNLTTRLKDLPAAAAGEPVGTIFLGLMETFRGGNRLVVNADAQAAWDAKPESFRQAMRAKVKRMSCPVLIMQGNAGNTFRSNSALLYPELEKGGADFDLRIYANMYHGFYWGNGRTTTTEVVERVVGEAVEYFSQYVAVRPRPWP